MSIVKTKGTLLKLTISASLTTIAQLDNVNIGQTKSVVIDVPTLDSGTAAIGKFNTGDVEQEDITFTGYYDPSGSTHQFITTQITTPISTPIAGSITFADTKTATFNAVGMAFGVSAATRDALKCSGSIQTPLVTMPAAT